MYDLRFYVLFSSISVILGQWVGDNARLCMQKNRPTFTIEQLPTSSRLKPGPLDQQAYGVTRAQRNRERERERVRWGNVCVGGGGWGRGLQIVG